VDNLRDRVGVLGIGAEFFPDGMVEELGSSVGFMVFALETLHENDARYARTVENAISR